MGTRYVDPRAAFDGVKYWMTVALLTETVPWQRPLLEEEALVLDRLAFCYARDYRVTTSVVRAAGLILERHGIGNTIRARRNKAKWLVAKARSNSLKKRRRVKR